MGNWCCGLHNYNYKKSCVSSSSMVWAADDDYGYYVSKSADVSIPNNNKPHILQVEKQSLLGGLDQDQNDDSSSSSSGNCTQSSHREVKIKISKKQLQELLATSGDDLHSIPMAMDDHVILSRLLKFKASTDQMNNNFDDQRSGWSWRPLLQTIPEHP